MLHAFLTAHKAELIERCSRQAASRRAPAADDPGRKYGIPQFLDQLIETLQLEDVSDRIESGDISGPSGTPASSQIGVAAARHGGELLHQGFTLDQVVHDYGDLCQAITALAFERGAPIEVGEFRTLNRCLDNAIAYAVTEFAHQRDLATEAKHVQAFNERVGFLGHELRNLVQAACHSVHAIKAGKVGLSGATGAVLDRSLIGLTSLIDDCLADVRATAGMPARHKPVSVAELIADVQVAATQQVLARNCRFAVSTVDPRLVVDVDGDLLRSALGNLLQNAFKFTRPQTEVSLNVYAAAGRIRFDVEDCCGGLPAGDPEKMFVSFTQNGADRSGLGLGLCICRRSVEANNGLLSVRDLPGKGCVFTIDLPQHALS